MVQEYLIIPKDSEPFTTNWFNPDNHYIEGSIVFNLHSGEYTTDGYEWQEVKEDNL